MTKAGAQTKNKASSAALNLTLLLFLHNPYRNRGAPARINIGNLENHGKRNLKVPKGGLQTTDFQFNIKLCYDTPKLKLQVIKRSMNLIVDPSEISLDTSFEQKIPASN